MDFTKLNRRADPDRCWLIYCDDVHVGTIVLAVGRPNAEKEWQWRAGFYPGSPPREIKTGTAENFELAKAAFRKAWLDFASSRTEADFQALRDHIDWTRRKYAALENGKRFPLGSLEAAWTEAARSIAEMARDKIPANGKSDLQLAIEVRTDHGPVLA